MLVISSYVLLAVALVAAAVRSFKILMMPVHLRWELSPVPHEKGKGTYGGSYLEEPEWWSRPREKSLVSEASYMFKEIVFLKALWEHNRRLWWFSFPFHLGLYLLVVVAGLVVLGGIAALAGVSEARLAPLETFVLSGAAAGYLAGAVGALGLTLSRLLDPRLRGIATPATWLNLLLLLGLFVSGGYAVLSVDTFSASVLAVASALLTVDLSVEVPGAVATHIVVAGVFLAYLPFTSMMHPVAKYFTYHQVRWDDEPLQAGGKMEKEIQELLGQPVSWAGSHVGSNGAKSWVEIATEVPEEAAQ
jgi:nitrate reductase gamma subunit